MKSYDDLQRFKEKTQTNHIEFKDMSGQSGYAASTDWAIINQLKNIGSGSVLDNSQHIGRAVPEPVDATVFAQPTLAPTAAPTVQTFTRVPQAARADHAQLDSIAGSLTTVAADGSVQPEGSAARHTQPAAAGILFAQLAENTQLPPQPQATADGREIRYKQLFSLVTDAASAVSKESLLQPLLEKIASCR